MTWSVLISITDEKAKTSTTQANVPAATTAADAELFAQQLALLIDPLITGAITRVGISKSVPLPGGLTAAAAANSDVEEGARFQFRTVNGFYSAMRLATFDEANIQAGSRAVDLTAAAAFTTAMVDGIDITGVGGSGTIQPCDQRDEDLTALEFAREQFLSSRK